MFHLNKSFSIFNESLAALFYLSFQKIIINIHKTYFTIQEKK